MAGLGCLRWPGPSGISTRSGALEPVQRHGRDPGFVMASAIWWIYYDSFHLLEQRRADGRPFDPLLTATMICYVLLNMRYRPLVPAAHAG
jgi:hypothetical protein